MLDRITTGAAMELYDDNIAVNTLAPESAVMTENASSLVEHSRRARSSRWRPSSRPRLRCVPVTRSSLTGRVTYSLSLLVELRRPVRTVDGSSLVAGWQPDEIDPARLRAGYLDHA